MTTPHPPTDHSAEAYRLAELDPERRNLGDVATAMVNGTRMIVQRTTAKQTSYAGGETLWATPQPVAGSRREVTSSWLIDARPLLVIDPYAETPDPLLDQLADEFCLARWDHQGVDTECDPLTRSSMREAARLVLSPPLAEPGLLAVVEAGGTRLGRTTLCQLEPGIEADQ